MFFKRRPILNLHRFLVVSAEDPSVEVYSMRARIQQETGKPFLDEAQLGESQVIFCLHPGTSVPEAESLAGILRQNGYDARAVTAQNEEHAAHSASTVSLQR